MQRAVFKRSLIVVALILLAALAALLGGCGDNGDKAATKDTSASSATTKPAAKDASDRQVIVGGKTEEEYAAALPGLKKAAEAKPKDIATLQDLAIAQYNTGGYEAAAVTYEKMLKIKADAFTQNNYGNVLRDWGKTNKDKIDEAIAAYEKSIKMDKALAIPYINLASVYSSQEQTDKAIETLDRGIKAVKAEDKSRLEEMKRELSPKK
ncbi:MAG: hypothetical protein ACOX8V_03600 [Thermoleophilia bacterium]|jgi:tetratricopeptide (TPR) repeat protein